MACRVCANTPFAFLFGAGDDEDDDNSSSLSSSNSVAVRRGFLPWESRLMGARIIEWKRNLHPRTLDLWGTEAHQEVNKICRLILASLDKRDDPVLGSPDDCVVWHGPVGIDDGVAVVNIPKTDSAAGESTATYVTRALTFMFGDDDSFDTLIQTYPTGPLDMTCGDPRCVNLRHVYAPPPG